MRHEAIDVRMMGARHETIDAQKRDARHETIDEPHASRLASKTPRSSRLTSHAPAPWPKVKLGDICNIFTGKKDVNQTVANGPYRFFSCAPTLFCSNEYIFDGAAIIIAGNGSYTGRVTYYEGKFDLYQRTYACTIIKPHLADIKFVYDVMRLRFQNEIRGSLKGASIPYIVKGHLSNFQIPLPPLPVQRRIADVLSAYDDLIENNRRRIAILEETARLTYRKWFGGEVGRTTTLGEVCQSFGGGTPKTSVAEYWNGDVSWVVPTDVTRNSCLALLDTERKITALGLEKSSAKMLPANAILMTSRASVGYFAIADFPVCTNQGFISIVPNDAAWQWYLLFNLMSRVEEIRGNAKGSTFPEISRARFRSMDIVVPDNESLGSFNDVVIPLMRQVRTLFKQSAALAAARDMLLPRLMKGDF